MDVRVDKRQFKVPSPPKRPAGREEEMGHPSPGIKANGGLDLETTLDSLLSSAHQVVNYDVAEIALWDEERQCCVTQDWRGSRAYAWEAGGVYRWARRDEVGCPG